MQVASPGESVELPLLLRLWLWLFRFEPTMICLGSWGVGEEMAVVLA